MIKNLIKKLICKASHKKYHEVGYTDTFRDSSNTHWFCKWWCPKCGRVWTVEEVTNGIRGHSAHPSWDPPFLIKSDALVSKEWDEIDMRFTVGDDLPHKQTHSQESNK